MRQRLTGLVITALLLCSGTAHAIPMLDQSNTVSAGDIFSLVSGSTTVSYQQGITAGLSGQLTQIDFFAGTETAAGNSALVTINLGAPLQTDTPDFSSMFAASGPGWNSVDLTAASIFLTAGDVFTLGIEGIGGGIPTLQGSVNAAYDGGEMFADVGSQIFALGPYIDLTFQTYVDPTAVPEPGILVLMAIGIAAIGLSRKRRAA